MVGRWNKLCPADRRPSETGAASHQPEPPITVEVGLKHAEVVQ